MIVDKVEDLIGNTPLIRLNKLSQISGANIYAKCEFMNPSSSIKDRVALNMINRALERGDINQDTIIIEPTSGNTGIGLAMICASKDLQLIIIMPDSMSKERRDILTHLGAKLFLTPSKDGMQGSIDKANELSKNIKNSIVLGQFNNSDNPDIHRKTTAIEIYNDLGSKIDFFVAGVGTGGTITGVGEVLKEKIDNIKIVAVEPFNSAVLSNKKVKSHKIEGIGAGFIPKILNIDIYDEIIKVKDKNAYNMARRVAKEEGLLVGISSGANIQASFEIAIREENRGKTIVTILADTAERYLSTEMFESSMF